MRQKGISQEGLKLIACLTMLIDHVGEVLVYAWYMTESQATGMHVEGLWNLYILTRIIGRIAFPIYCFLLVEGAHYTRNPKRYGVRLFIGILIAELPYDLAFYGGWFWGNNSVMITLFLGFVMLQAMKRMKLLWKFLLIIPFYLLADLMMTDYAGHGILIIAFLALTRDVPQEKLLRLVGMTMLLWFDGTISIGAITVPMELFGLFSLIPIFCYSGRKLTRSKVVQWAFYLFYPVHLAVLWLLNGLLFT